MSAPHQLRDRRSPLNQNLSLSSHGRTQLIRREGLISHYYNDSAHNCTYGVGTLAHLGPCSAREMQTPVTGEQMAASLQHGVSSAERTVKRTVTRRHLTQEQFDALVSFTYNVGAGGAHHVLGLVNSGHLSNAAHTMMRYTHATVNGPNGTPQRDRQGQIVTRVLPGLVTRRTDESAPFRTHEDGRHR